MPEKYQQHYNETDLEYHPFCTELFAKLEAAKRENFPKETMRIWFIEFVKRGWTKKMLIKRYEALLGKPIFGKENLEFADWVNAVPVYGEDEMVGMVKRKIETIIQRGKYLLNHRAVITSLTIEDTEAIEVALANELSFAIMNEKMQKVDDYRERRRAELRNKKLKV